MTAPKPDRFSGIPFAVALLVIGAGCSKRPSPPTPSNFLHNRGFEHQYAAAAKQADVKLMDRYGFDQISNPSNNSCELLGGESFCGRPEQADAFMRALHAEVAQRLRAENVEPRDEPPTGPTEITGWTIAYTSGSLEGTAKATRDERRVGPCGPNEFYYKVNFRVTEMRKPK